MASLQINAVEPSNVAAVWDDLRRSYDPPLMGGYDFDVFVAKVAAYAMTFSLCEDGVLVGAVSFYANDVEGKVAYITNIAVARDFAGRHLGEKLLAAAVEESRARGMQTLRLEVKRTNARALALYRRFGFVEEAPFASGQSIYMSLSLGVVTT